MSRPAKSLQDLQVDPDFDDPHAVSPLNKQIRDQRIAFMRVEVRPTGPIYGENDPRGAADVLAAGSGRSGLQHLRRAAPRRRHPGDHAIRRVTTDGIELGRHPASTWTSSSWPPGSRPTTSCGRWRSAAATAARWRTCGRQDGPGPISAPCSPGSPTSSCSTAPTPTSCRRPADRRHRGDGHPVRARVHRGTDQPGQALGRRHHGRLLALQPGLDQAERLWRTSTPGPTTTTKTSTAARRPTGPSTPGSCGTGSAIRPLVARSGQPRSTRAWSTNIGPSIRTSGRTWSSRDTVERPRRSTPSSQRSWRPPAGPTTVTREMIPAIRKMLVTPPATVIGDRPIVYSDRVIPGPSGGPDLAVTISSDPTGNPGDRRFTTSTEEG